MIRFVPADREQPAPEARARMPAGRCADGQAPELCWQSQVVGSAPLGRYRKSVPFMTIGSGDTAERPGFVARGSSRRGFSGR